MSMKSFFKSEDYKKYRTVLSGVIDGKMRALVESEDEQKTRQYQREIRALVWVRDELPKELIRQEEAVEPIAPPTPGSEYDAQEEGKEASQDGGYGPEESSPARVSVSGPR